MLNRSPGSLSDFRSDYKAKDDEFGVEQEINDLNQRKRAVTGAHAKADLLKSRFAGVRTQVIDAAEQIADQKVLAQIAKVNARNRRLHIHVNAHQLGATTPTSTPRRRPTRARGPPTSSMPPSRPGSRRLAPGCSTRRSTGAWSAT